MIDATNKRWCMRSLRREEATCVVCQRTEVLSVPCLPTQEALPLSELLAARGWSQPAGFVSVLLGRYPTICPKCNQKAEEDKK